MLLECRAMGKQETISYIATGKAAAMLGVTAETLRSYAIRGYIRPVVLPSGRMRWPLADVERLRAVAS